MNANVRRIVIRRAVAGVVLLVSVAATGITGGTAQLVWMAVALVTVIWTSWKERNA